MERDRKHFNQSLKLIDSLHNKIMKKGIDEKHKEYFEKSAEERFVKLLEGYIQNKTSIHFLELSRRSLLGLTKAKIFYIEDLKELLEKEDGLGRQINKVRGLGKISVDEIETKLNEYET